MTHIIHIIGIAGAEETTLRAVRALESVDAWIGSARQIELARELSPGAKAEEVPYRSLDRMKEALDHLLGEGKTVGVLASGDPVFYGITPFIRRNYPEATIEVLSGISSVQMLFARLGLPMHDVYKTSVHGREADFDRLAAYPRVCLLTDTKWTARAVAEAFLERGRNLPMYIGSYLGYPHEELIVTTTEAASKVADYDRFTFAVVLIGDFGVEPMAGRRA